MTEQQLRYAMMSIESQECSTEETAKYSHKDSIRASNELTLWDVSTEASSSTVVTNLNTDYVRARMLVASLLTKVDADAEYIKRLETLNDKLMGTYTNGL